MAASPKILKGLRIAESGNTDIIIQALRDSKKTGTPLHVYWDNIPKAALNEFTEVQLELIETGDQSKVVSPDVSKDNAISTLIIARHFLSGYKITEKEGQVILFQVIDEKDKTLAPLYDKDFTKVLIRDLSIKWLNEIGEPISPKTAGEFVSYWFNHEQPIPVPEPMGRLGADDWCLHRSTYFPDPEVAYPSWMKILDRMSEPEAFSAWHWGVFSGLYKGRQMIWLHGPNGEDGKSTLASTIGKNLYGPAHNAISNASIGSGEKRFLNSFFENAALVIYPDANNRKCLMSEAFKTVASAGADPVLIERKGRQAYTSVLKARMWICSNHAPEVTNNNFIISRLLYIHIDKMVNETPDPTVFERLEAELSGFLAYARECYEKLCPDNYKIQTKSTTQEKVSQLSSEFFDEYETIFTKYWQTSESHIRVDASKVRDLLRSEGVTNNIAYSNYVEWMTKHKGIVKRKVSSEGGKIYYHGMDTCSPIKVSAIDTPDF